MFKAVQDLEHFLRVIKGEKYLVNLVPAKGVADRSTHIRPHKPFYRSAEDILAERKAYFRGNTSGMRDVYARIQDVRYVLADDILTKDLHKVYQYRPTLVVETSRDNHQVWFRCDSIETPAEQHNAARWLVHAVGADKGAIGPNHLARLPGFYNRKPGRKKHLVKIHRDDRKYLPGQCSTLPDEAYQYTWNKYRATETQKFEDDVYDADDDITQSQPKKRRRESSTRDSTESSGTPMSQSESDSSSDDWRYCMSRLEDTHGEVQTHVLERDLISRSRKTNPSVNYFRNTVARAIDHYHEMNRT